MRIAALLAGAFIVLACLGAAAQDNKRGPSTADERKRFLSITRELVRAPLDGKRADVGWALKFLSDVPDIVVNPCGVPLENLTTSGHPHAATLFSVYVLAMGAYTIEQPDKAKDPAEQFQAGVDAALRAYQAILRREPGSTSEDMDDLLARRQAGTLQGFVQEASKVCTSTGGQSS